MSTPPAETPPATPTNPTAPPPSSLPHTASNLTASPAPVSPPSPKLSGATLTALVVGAGLGGLIVLIAVGIWFFFYRRWKKRTETELLTKNDYFAHPSQHGQQNVLLPPENEFLQLPKPIPPGIEPNIQSPAVPALSPPVQGSTNSSLGSQKPVPPLSFESHLGSSSRGFTYEELALATENFSTANLLGQGGFGYVYKGFLPNGKEIAVKQLKAGGMQGEREFQAEVDTISRVHHKHLVSLVGYCISGSQRLLVYEFVPNKTLEFHLHGDERPTLSWSTRLIIALGAAKGLAYLHEDCQPKIIHRDIKASNILLDDNFEAKVADFGLAKFSFDTDTHISTRVMGTFGYLAPEYAASGKLTEKSDVFSFGVVLLELITGRRPIDKAQSFRDDSMVEWARPLLVQALEDGNFDDLVDPRLCDYNSSEMAQMVACAVVCIRHSARLRPQMSQVVQALEGTLSIKDLFTKEAPSHGRVHRSADYDSSQYGVDINKLWKLAFESQEQSIISEHGANARPSTSSTENQHDTREMEMGKMKDEYEIEREIPIL
ncbi:hypothetical protein Nepgr_005520 [Nepenthes gracilis]|uniref:non-specific serine/threonine protein kinase n=1 Tax=Nepenthes gracilis TaxID=150966 RepID=A0AAD3S3N1_NEPGR|nr:hypothetical protein Nepgr_005520 [Nepenthes gracilis]